MKDWTAYLKGGWSVVEPWALTIVCGLGVVAHLAGIFAPESVGVATFILGICLVGGVGVSVKERLERNGVSRAFADYEDPALWVLALWAVLSVVGLLGGELFIVAICLVAWVCATQPRQSVITALSTSCSSKLFWANGVTRSVFPRETRLTRKRRGRSSQVCHDRGVSSSSTRSSRAEQQA